MNTFLHNILETIHSDSMLYGIILGIILIGIQLLWGPPSPLSHFKVTYNPEDSDNALQSDFVSCKKVKTMREGNKSIRNYHFEDIKKNIIIVPEERVIKIKKIFQSDLIKFSSYE